MSKVTVMGYDMTPDEKATWDRAMDETYPQTFFDERLKDAAKSIGAGAVHKVYGGMTKHEIEHGENQAFGLKGGPVNNAAAVGAGSAHDVPFKLGQFKPYEEALEECKVKMTAIKPAKITLEDVRNANKLAGFDQEVRYSDHTAEEMNNELNTIGSIAHAGEGWVDVCRDGDTIFMSPDDKESFRLCANGDFKAHGQSIPDVYGVYRRFHEWLEACSK